MSTSPQQTIVPLPPRENLLAPSAGRHQTRDWNLGDGAVMTVSLPVENLSKKNIARLKKFVAALEVEAAVTWDDDDEQEAP